MGSMHHRAMWSNSSVYATWGRGGGRQQRLRAGPSTPRPPSPHASGMWSQVHNPLAEMYGHRICGKHNPGDEPLRKARAITPRVRPPPYCAMGHRGFIWQ